MQDGRQHSERADIQYCQGVLRDSWSSIGQCAELIHHVVEQYETVGSFRDGETSGEQDMAATLWSGDTARVFGKARGQHRGPNTSPRSRG